jgi:hypothetical protein
MDERFEKYLMLSGLKKGTWRWIMAIVWYNIAKRR